MLSAPQSPAELLDRVHQVEANAQLLMVELRSVRLLADQTAATLSLIVGLLAATREADGGFLLARLFQELLLCAENAEMAARISGCEADIIDPQMIRASAALLTGDVGAVLRSVLGDGATAH